MKYNFLEYKIGLTIFHSQFFKELLVSKLSKEEKKVLGKIYEFGKLNLRIPYEDEVDKKEILYFVNHYCGNDLYTESYGYEVTFQRVCYDKQNFIVTKEEYDKIDKELTEIITSLFMSNGLCYLDSLIEEVFNIINKKFNLEIKADMDKDEFLTFFDIVEEIEYYKADFFLKYSLKDFWSAEAYSEEFFGFLGYLHFQPNSDEMEEFIENEPKHKLLSMRYMTLDENQGYENHENPWQAIKYLKLEHKTYFIRPWYSRDSKKERIKDVYDLLIDIFNNDDLNKLVTFYNAYNFFINVVKKTKFNYYDFNFEEDKKLSS